MSVQLVVLDNGLQLLADVEAEAGVVTLKKPVQLAMVPQEGPDSGRMNMAFLVFMQYVDEWETGISIDNSKVLAIVTPQTDLLNSYNQRFGSGLVLPGSDTLQRGPFGR